MHGMFGWIDPRMIAAMQEEQAAKAQEAEVKAVEESKKTPEERLAEAKQNCVVAGQRFCSRILGMLDRETGKLVDQFSDTLTGHEKEVTKILWKEFLSELDIAIKDRKIKR